MVYKSKFFKHKKLPFIESRFVKNSSYLYNEHFHTTLSIGAVEDGQVAYTHQKDKYILKPNFLAVINPNKIHSCNPIYNESRTYHMIYIDKDWCKELQKSIFTNTQSFIEVSKVNIENKELFQKYLKLNYTLLDQESSFLEKEELLQEFLTELFQKYCNCQKTKKKEFSNIEQKVELAKNFIKNNYLENITIGEISKYVELSEFYFIKQFKAHTFLSPHQYMLNCKIDMAKNFLFDGMDIVEVALSLGFSDQSHFNRVFKKFVAATPNEYKKSIITQSQ